MFVMLFLDISYSIVVIMSNQAKNTIIIPATEYSYLKKIERSFEQFFGSFSHLKEIEQARKEIKQRKYLSQNIVFKKLGL